MQHFCVSLLLRAFKVFYLVVFKFYQLVIFRGFPAQSVFIPLLPVHTDQTRDFQLFILPFHFISIYIAVLIPFPYFLLYKISMHVFFCQFHAPLHSTSFRRVCGGKTCTKSGSKL